MRAGGALAAVGTAVGWFNEVKDSVLNEVIANLGRDLTTYVEWPLAVYGLGEAVNAYKEFKQKAVKGVADYIGCALRSAPLVSPAIAACTDGDFLWSVLAPAAACVTGYGVEYVRRLFKKD